MTVCKLKPQEAVALYKEYTAILNTQTTPEDEARDALKKLAELIYEVDDTRSRHIVMERILDVYIHGDSYERNAGVTYRTFIPKGEFNGLFIDYRWNHPKKTITISLCHKAPNGHVSLIMAEMVKPRTKNLEDA